MKTIATLLLMLTGLIAFGTHNISGDITYKWVSGYTYEVTVRTFSYDTAADRDSIEIDFGDGYRIWTRRTNGPVLNGMHQGELCLYSHNVKKNLYVARHTFAGAVPFYVVSVTDPNRIDNIININGGNSVNIPFYLEDTIRFYDPQYVTPNNSPKVYSPAIVNGKLSVPLQYNLTAGDIDGDSLVFELVPPMRSWGVTVPNYQFPYEVNPSPDVFEIDPISGTITWDSPQQIGIYNVAILITEYRLGRLKMGTVLHDLQIIITDDLVSTQGNFDSLVFKTTPHITLNIGDTLNVTADFNIGSVTSQYGLEMYSPLFEWASPDTVRDYSVNKITGNFVLGIDSSLARIQPYILTFRGYTNVFGSGTQYHYMTDESLLIYINGGKRDTLLSPIPDGIFSSTIDNIDVTVFPNPVSNQLQVRGLNESYTKLKLKIFHTDGKQVNSFNITGNTKIDVSDLATGLYIYQI